MDAVKEVKLMDFQGKEKTPEKTSSMDNLKKKIAERPKQKAKAKKKAGPGRPRLTPEPEEKRPDETAITLGASTAEMVFMAGHMIGGDEWEPSPQERQFMSQAWGRYYELKNMKDIPPGMLVVFALLTYTAPRLRKPKTQARLIAAYLKVREWIRSKFKRGQSEAQPQKDLPEKADPQKKDGNHGQ